MSPFYVDMDLGVSDLKGEGRVIGRVELAYRFWKALTSLTSRSER